jgi:hypothetical protein
MDTISLICFILYLVSDFVYKRTSKYDMFSSVDAPPRSVVIKLTCYL